MELILFYLFSGLAIASALMVIFLPQPTRSLLSLVVTMFSLAVLFILLGAPFIAMVHLIVYAGAVLVLFLFVIMLQGVGAKDIPFKSRFPLPHLAASLAVSIGVASSLILILNRFSFQSPKGISGSPELIGKILFQDYLLPFELTSLILLLGIFAAVALAKKEPS